VKADDDARLSGVRQHFRIIRKAIQCQQFDLGQRSDRSQFAVILDNLNDEECDDRRRNQGKG